MADVVLPWRKSYVDRVISDATEYPTEAIGAREIALSRFWKFGPLPGDEGALAFLLGLSLGKWRKYKRYVLAPFSLTFDGWVCPELQRERADTGETKEKRLNQTAAARRVLKEKREAEKCAKEEAALPPASNGAMHPGVGHA
jgi:uncharacterized protein YdaU (DUF1376 family)